VSHLSQVSIDQSGTFVPGEPSGSCFSHTFRLGIKGSFFCGQECFKAGCESSAHILLFSNPHRYFRRGQSWAVDPCIRHLLILNHKFHRKLTKSSMKSPHLRFPPMVRLSQTMCPQLRLPLNHDAYHLTLLADNTSSPFPNFSFSGPLRPVYPLSPTRVMPDHIPRPDYAEDGSLATLFPMTSQRTDVGPPCFFLRNACFRIEACRPAPPHIEPGGAGEDENRLQGRCTPRFCRQGVTVCDISKVSV
jgi:hypothetical protein